MFFFPIFLWYDKWKFEVSEGDTVIVHASNYSEKIINFLNSKFDNIRIIHWFWNPVSVYSNINLENSKCELWSFDMNDCDKYGMSFNTTHYFRNLKLPELLVKNDVFFIGYDKGRREYIDSLRNIMGDYNVRTNFIVLSKNSKQNIPYDKVLSYISESKAILDILQIGQNGLSLRPMESIFFNKKLITTDKNIVNEDFYSSENIFVLGKDDMCKLKSFLNRPYKKIDASIVEKYEVSNWINRFFE